MKLKTIIISSLFLSALVFLHFSTGLFTPYNYFIAKLDIFNNNYRILQYGEAKTTDSIATKVSSDFGFRYDIVEGCEVNSTIVNGIKTYNSVMVAHLDKSYGSSWHTDFEAKVDSLFRESRIDTIKQIVSSRNEYKSLEQAFAKLYHGKRKLDILVLIHKDNGDNVRVCEKLGDTAIRVFNYYHIDPYSLKLSIVRY